MILTSVEHVFQPIIHKQNKTFPEVFLSSPFFSPTPHFSLSLSLILSFGIPGWAEVFFLNSN